MTLEQKYKFLVRIFLVFGTVSCIKDKEKVIYLPITNHYNLGVTDSQERMQKFEEIQSMDLGGTLNIDLWKSRDFKKEPLLIQVQSRCLTDSLQGEILQDQHFQNRSTIPIINLIATEALVSTSQNPLRCSFKVTLKEKTSTANIFNLDNVVITDSTTFNNTTLFSESPANNVQIFENLKPLYLPSMDFSYLRCRDFTKTAGTSDNTLTWEQFLGEIATMQTNWFSSSQSCRFYGKQGEKILLSQPFQLLFNPQPLIFEPLFHYLKNANPHLTSRKVLTLRLTNPNSYRVRLRVEKPQQNQFLFQPVYARGDAARAQFGNIHTFPMSFHLEDTPYLESSSEEEWVVIIPPFQQIEIFGHALINIKCNILLFGDGSDWYKNSPRIGNFAGLYFGFDFKTSLSLDRGENHWTPISLYQQELAKLQIYNPAFWDTHYMELKKHFGNKLPHNAKSEEEFISTLYIQQGMDFCRE